jgi:hypothetical protein
MFTKKRRALKKQVLANNKRKSNKKRRHRRKLTKRNKHVKKFRTMRNQKYMRGGGKWIDGDTLPEDEICSICLQKFSETPEQAVYKTNCGHVFHNNCLNNTCISNERSGRDLVCPLCREELQTDDGEQCMDVWAFANKRLGLGNNLDEKGRAIYDAQPDDE